MGWVVMLARVGVGDAIHIHLTENTYGVGCHAR